jgi:hypothetical protein
MLNLRPSVGHVRPKSIPMRLLSDIEAVFGSKGFQSDPSGQGFSKAT